MVGRVAFIPRRPASWQLEQIAVGIFCEDAHHRDPAELDMLDKQLQRRGIGSILLRRLELLANQNGVSEITGGMSFSIRAWSCFDHTEFMQHFIPTSLEYYHIYELAEGQQHRFIGTIINSLLIASALLPSNSKERLLIEEDFHLIRFYQKNGYRFTGIIFRPEGGKYVPYQIVIKKILK